MWRSNCSGGPEARGSHVRGIFPEKQNARDVNPARCLMLGMDGLRDYWLTGIGVLGVFLAGDNVAHGAHVGGMVMGFAFVRYTAVSDKHIRDAGK